MELDGTLAPPPDESAAQAQTNEGVARATGVLALGNVTSRILGLAREIVIANLFGASAAVDAFLVAALIPRNLYDLLIGGHVNGAVVPVLSEVAALKGRDALWRLVSILLSMLTASLAALTLLLEVAAPLIVRVVGGGFDSYTQDLAVSLLRLTSPALIFMGIFAILSGALYALKTFAWPAFATAVFNACIVAAALVFTPAARGVVRWEGAMTGWAFARPDSGITVVALGWLAGSMAYVLLQMPGLRGARLRFTLRWRHPAIRQIGLLYVPVMFSLVLDTLVVRLFSYNLASSMGAGSIAYMNWATTLIQFPQGLVATAISVAILPTLSQQAALITVGDSSKQHSRAFTETLGLGLRLAFTLIMPAAVGLFVLAGPIIALIFQHGAFTAADTAASAEVLRLYLIGLPFAAVDLLLVYAFYARQDTFTPAVIGLFSLTLYMVVALALAPRYGLLSLMMADSIKHIVHALTSGLLLRRRVGGLGDRRLLVTVVKTLAASAVMGLCAFTLLPLLQDAVGAGTFWGELLLVALGGGAGTGLFLLLAAALRIEEWRWLNGLLRRRFVGG